MLYNDTIKYSVLKKTVNEAVIGKQIEKLVEATKVVSIHAYMMNSLIVSPLNFTFDLALLELYHY